MPKNTANSIHINQKGFTILELGIVAIVISVVVISLIAMMQEVNMRYRDAVRLSDMANIYQVIQAKIHTTEAKDKLYYILCSQVKTPCEGASYPLKSTTRKIDGSGWLRIIFSKDELIKYAILPLDPVNNEQYNYHYYSDGKMWKVSARLESKEHRQKMIEDNGTDPNKYEIIQKLQ